MKDKSLSRRYAKALVNAITSEEEFNRINEELAGFSELMRSDSDLKAGLETLLFSQSQKLEVLEAVFKKTGFHEKTANFLRVLAEENRVVYFESIISLMKEIWLEKKGIMKLSVSSAVPLSEKQENDLVKKLESVFNKGVVLEKNVDPDLIAGIMIQKDSVCYDFSISGNLKRLKQILMEEN